MFGYEKFTILVLDTETNGLTPKESVLAASLLSLALFYNPEEEDVQMFATDFECRYYFRAEGEPVNPHALNVHQLTEERLAKLRMENAQIGNPLYLVEDLPWLREKLMEHDLIVGHNLAFDLRMTISDELVKDRNKRTFCTMKDPRDIYKTISPEPIKHSVSLARAADLLQVDYNKEGKHDATIDTFVTAKVLNELFVKFPELVKKHLID